MCQGEEALAMKAVPHDRQGRFSGQTHGDALDR